MPRTTLEGQALWTLRLTPVFSSSVSAGYLTYDADNTADSALNVAALDAGRDLRADENLRRPRRHRLCRPAARGHQRRRRPRDHPEQQGAPMRGDFRYTPDNFVLFGNAR